MARFKLLRFDPGFARKFTLRSHCLALIFFALAGPAVFAQSTTQVLVATNSTWRFFRGTNEASVPPTEWRTNTFDDSSWETGPAPFFYGTNYTNSILFGTHLSDMPSNYSCIFIRQTFTLTNAAQYIALTNRPFADDGYVTWVNGIEVTRQNLGSPGVFYGYNSNAASAVFFTVPRQVNAFTNALRVGVNVMAVQIFNVSSNDVDFFANPELTAGVADVLPPTVLSVTPPAGSSVTNIVQLTVVFSESVTNVRTTDLRINGTPAASLTSNSTVSYTFRFPMPPAGTVTAAWNPAAAIKDISGNLFNPTNVWQFSHFIDAPRVASATPAFGATITNPLTQIIVVFNRSVTGVAVDDLLVNGEPATGLSGSNTTYTFTLATPPSVSAIQVGFDANQVIVDDAGVRMVESSNTWTYTYVDTIPPAILSRTPAAGATVGSLAQVEVMFNEPVSGVDASDLLVNGTPAQSAVGSGAGPYLFQFAPPATGTVQVAWSVGHNIRDTAPAANPFAGGSWTVTLNPALFSGDVVINEFAAANILSQASLDFSEFNVPEDWVELYNRGPNAVRLLGWSLSNDQDQPGLWTFPDITLNSGQYLVVYASGLDRRVLGGTNRLHTNFKLNPFGDYLALFNAEFPRHAVSEFAPEFPEQRNDYSYGLNTSNQWRYYATPTPGAANGNSAIAVVAPKPHVSVARGYFDRPFTLVASCDLPGATMRYTTDGSEPTAVTGFAYNGPFVISNSTVLRISAFGSNALPSKATSHSYLFLDSIFRQPNNPGPTFPNTFGTQSGTFVSPSDYEMDPEILTNAAYKNLVTNALLSLPAISIMIKPADMWDPVTGLYTHTLDRGPQWEKPCSMEFFTPDGSEQDFQVDAGIQAQGNASREPLKQPKHPLKVQFKGDYGPANLKYKIFQDSPREEFDSVNLRVDFNFSWLHWDGAQRARGQRTRDAWMKDSMRAMGGLAGHNRYVHLYINGLYWGVCDPSERPDASFAAAYLGGEKEEFDAINEAHQAVDGTTTVLNQMLALTNAPSIAQYETFKQYLDVTQFIDYIMLHFFVGHEDWGFRKNFYTIRRRVAGQGFKYIPWDGENILGTDVNRNDTTRISTSDTTGTPSELHPKLIVNPQYRLDFADRVHRHFFNNGALMPTNTIARWMNRAKQVDLPIILESARWGDYRRDVHVYQTAPYELYERNNQWLTEQNRLTGTYFPQRTAIVLAQLRAQNLYPSNTAPVFNQHGGRVPAGFTLTMSATNTIYYTTNGIDPRIYGSGGISGVAQQYTGPLTLGASMVVKARMLAGTNWSALNEASFVVGSLTPSLRFTEIMYNPFGGDAFEYLELQNTGPLALNIGNYSFSGITFAFPVNYELPAGQRIVLANNLSSNAFALRYPGVAVAGWYAGNLANGGETITLLDSSNRVVLSVSYDDENGWPTLADGPGNSLEIVNVDGDPDDPTNWRASNGFGGTPGAPNSPPPPATVVLNEIMADNISAVNHGGIFPDWIELYNSTGAAINLTGWSLTDDGNPRKFVFNGTSIGASNHLVVWATTNALPGITLGFALGRNGDTVFLYDANTNLVDAISFGPQVPNLTVGRIGGAWTLTTPTTNAPNVAATLGSVSSLSINEWLANAVPGADDWLELFNPSANPVPLRNLYFGTSNALFQLRSLSYVPAGGFVQLIADERPGPDHLDFRLNAAAGAIILYDSTGAEATRVTYGSQAQGVSQGRLPDGTANIVLFPNSASPAASNYVLNYTGPVLNELLARNSSAVVGPFANYSDYVEIFNPTTNTFNLTGMGLSDDADEIKFVFGPGTTIASNGYLVVWCDSSRAPSTTGTLNSGFALNGSSGGAYLFNSIGQLVNFVEYGFQVTDLPIGLSGGQWRLLGGATPGSNNAAPATLGATGSIRINEWMADPGNGENDWFELHNSAAQPVSLAGLYLTDDPSLAGLSNTPIANLSFIGAKDWVKWIADNDPSDGRDHTGFDLDKDGDSIRLYASNFSLLDAVSFGAQLEGVSQGRLPDSGTNIVSFPTTPTPESANYLPLGNVIINEVLTHTDPPLEDAIEIQNVGPTNLSIGDWWISNSQRDLKKFRIASGTTLTPGQFLVFYENQFNAGGNGTGTNFTLNAARGDAVHLSEGDAGGNLSGYRASVGFGAAENGVSFGRFATSTGIDFTAMAQRSFGADLPANVAEFRTGTGLSNGYPKVGPVVINEIMYQPVSGTNAVELANEEFVELRNITMSPMPMFDPARPTNGWRMAGGISFNFNSNTTIGATGYVTLVAFDPATNGPALAAFRAKYGTNGPILGPYSGRLDNSGEAVELYKPDAPQLPPHPDAGIVPMILVDRVAYGVTNPWPSSAAGGGASLQRLASSLYGNDVLNWTAQPPNSGAPNGVGDVIPPTISAQPQNQTVIRNGTANFSVTGQGTAPLTYQWLHAGTNIPGATSSNLSVVNAQPADAGLYRVVVNNVASYIFSQGATLTVLVPAFIAVPPQSQSAIAGTTVQFNVTPGGTPPFYYQWRKNGSDLGGENAAQLTIINAQPPNEGNYSVVVTNNYGAITSVVAALTVVVPPAITSSPTNVTVLQNDSAVFAVSATGTAPLGYQWRKDGINIPGANSPTYTIVGAQISDEGLYSAIVTNAAGSATSASAVLQVNTAASLFAPQIRSDGVFQFTLLGRSNRNYSVEYSTDFAGWTNLTNLTLPGSQAPITDVASNATWRFYRVRVNP